MPRLTIQQVRSGEGWILTLSSLAGPEAIPSALPDLLAGPLLAASPDFGAHPPPGAERLGGTLVALRGDAARAFLADAPRWPAAGVIFACVPELPDDDARRRFIPDPVRPWDAERLKATFYGQAGGRYHHRGLWFAKEHDRRRFVEASVSRLLAGADLGLPPGDATLVLETPTDSTFEAVFTSSGRGDGFRLVRRFPERGFVRTWSVRRGEWIAEERKLEARGASGTFAARAAQFLASAGIVLLTIPTFLMVLVVALVARLSGTAATTSATRLPPGAR